jgi:hypothetical protein
MTIGEQTVKWYEANEAPGAFAAVLLRCFLFGVVIKRPDFVLIGEAVLTDGKKIVAVGEGCRKNCWWIHFWGSEKPMSSYDLCLEAPYPLAWVAFKRRGKTKIVPWDKLYWKDFNLKKESVYTLERQGY